MNFLRNPVSIKKVLNTIGPLLHYEPTDPEILAQFRMVVDGSKPQEVYLCRALGITPDEYRGWLRALFLMLTRLVPDQPNFMEHTVSTRSAVLDSGSGREDRRRASSLQPRRLGAPIPVHVEAARNTCRNPGCGPPHREPSAIPVSRCQRHKFRMVQSGLAKWARGKPRLSKSRGARPQQFPQQRPPTTLKPNAESRLCPHLSCQ